MPSLYFVSSFLCTTNTHHLSIFPLAYSGPSISRIYIIVFITSSYTTISCSVSWLRSIRSWMGFTLTVYWSTLSCGTFSWSSLILTITFPLPVSSVQVGPHNLQQYIIHWIFTVGLDKHSITCMWTITSSQTSSPSYNMVDWLWKLLLIGTYLTYKLPY